MTIIGICGRKRSGKDTTAALLVKEAGFTQMSFADKLKELTAALLGMTTEYVKSDAFKEAGVFSPLDAMFKHASSSEILSGRDILQKLGTAARKTFGEQFWAEQVLREATRLHGYNDRVYPNVVISDVRYWSELWAVKRAGGLIVRLNRCDRERAHNHVALGLAECCSETNCDFPFPSGAVCGLPRASHPTHWTRDTHPSETELPDDGSFYDFVCEQPSAEHSAQAVLVWVKGRMP